MTHTLYLGMVIEYDADKGELALFISERPERPCIFRMTADSQSLIDAARRAVDHYYAKEITQLLEQRLNA